MKVGIITFHDASNYGAALQTQATIDAFKSFDVDAEILDYSNSFRRGIYPARSRIFDSIKQLNIKSFILNMLAIPGIIRRNSAFTKYRIKFIKTSKNKFQTSSNFQKAVCEYDVLVSGSDQIWSYRNNGGDFNFLLGFENADLKKVSYASSFGMVSIPDEFQAEYKKHLDDYALLSTREETGVGLIKELTGRNASLVLDPVLLHDKNHWDKFVVESNNEESHDLLYVNTINVIDKLPFKNKVFSLGSFKLSFLFNSRFKLRNHEGPSEFIGYIKNAEIIYTTSYHAVIFSLIYNKPFYVFLSGNEGRDSRIKNLLKMFSLEERLIKHGHSISDWTDQVDFTSFNSLISSLRTDSYAFIEKSLFSGKT